MRREGERDWRGDQVSPETLIGIQKRSSPPSCPASLRGPPGLHEVSRSGPGVLRCSLQISSVPLWQELSGFSARSTMNDNDSLVYRWLVLSSVWLQVGNSVVKLIGTALNPLRYWHFDHQLMSRSTFEAFSVLVFTLLFWCTHSLPAQRVSAVIYRRTCLDVEMHKNAKCGYILFSTVGWRNVSEDCCCTYRRGRGWPFISRERKR